MFHPKILLNEGLIDYGCFCDNSEMKPSSILIVFMRKTILILWKRMKLKS